MWILQKHPVLQKRTTAELTDGNQEPCQHVLENGGCGHVPKRPPYPRRAPGGHGPGVKSDKPASSLQIHTPMLF